MDFMELLYGGSSQAGLVAVFLLATAFIVIAGLKLGDYGDALGERTGLGSGIVGLIFLAMVTSLPDLTVSISAAINASLQSAALEGQQKIDALRTGADLAAGNLLGSDLFNLMIFALIDITQGQGALLYRLSRKHILSAACSLFLLGLLITGFALEKAGGPDLVLPFLNTGVIMPFVALAYIGCLYVVGKLERTDHGLDAPDFEEAISESKDFLLNMKASRFYGMLTFLCVLIVGSGVWLSGIGERMALPSEQGGFGMSASFVGTIFLAIATSLPEMVVSYAAVRLKAFDMAVGNILGSNIFNLAGLFLVDCALRGHSLLNMMSPSQLATMGLVVVLTNIVIVGLIMRTRRCFLHIGIDIWLLILLYAGGNVCLYFLGE